MVTAEGGCRVHAWRCRAEPRAPGSEVARNAFDGLRPRPGVPTGERVSARFPLQGGACSGGGVPRCLGNFCLQPFAFPGRLLRKGGLQAYGSRALHQDPVRPKAIQPGGVVGADERSARCRGCRAQTPHRGTRASATSERHEGVPRPRRADTAAAGASWRFGRPCLSSGTGQRGWAQTPPAPFIDYQRRRRVRTAFEFPHPGTISFLRDVSCAGCG
jgi:hypothetical protein